MSWDVGDDEFVKQKQIGIATSRPILAWLKNLVEQRDERMMKLVRKEVGRLG